MPIAVEEKLMVAANLTSLHAHCAYVHCMMLHRTLQLQAELERIDQLTAVEPHGTAMQDLKNLTERCNQVSSSTHTCSFTLVARTRDASAHCAALLCPLVDCA